MKQLFEIKKSRPKPTRHQLRAMFARGLFVLSEYFDEQQAIAISYDRSGEPYLEPSPVGLFDNPFEHPHVLYLHPHKAHWHVSEYERFNNFMEEMQFDKPVYSLREKLKQMDSENPWHEST